MRQHAVYWIAILLCTGCSAIPDVVHEPQYHNPFPQISRVAVLPFFNQSADPTIDQDRIALAYYNELQQIPGFEVMPVGVAKRMLEGSGVEAKLNEGSVSGEDFQRLAQSLGVDAVVVGSVTEYTPYYPPRLGLSVRWYAANPGFHPIPPGYGLPWGTSKEKSIPEPLVFEAEFALAQEQLKTQTPSYGGAQPAPAALREDAVEAIDSLLAAPLESSAQPGPGGDLPPDWPDPRGFVPPPPCPTPPPFTPQTEPVLRHTQLYEGNDTDFTRRLARYYYLRDEARFGGWQGYLQRSEDFIRFCCYLHITEMLAARGGAGETRVVWRWPIDRYEP
jgi:hypothetical protein